MKCDLLTFKQLELGNSLHWKGKLEAVRGRLLRFYSDYDDFKGHKFHIINRMNSIIADCDLPFPCELLSLLEKAECASEPEIFYSSWHRDHLLHSLNLFCFGSLLITRFSCVKTVFGDEPIEKMLKKWALCALLHDVGYIATVNEELKTDLVKSFASAAGQVIFQLICAFGHNSDVTRNMDAMRAENDSSLRAITDSARKLLFDGRLGTPRPASDGNRSISFDYFTKANTYHGISSAVMLTLCKEIGESISCQTESIFQLGIDLPDPALWSGLENPLQAIALHDNAQLAHSQMGSPPLLNPWIPFLHLMDELTEYDRPALNPTSTRVVTPISSVEIEIVGGCPVIHFPRIERWRDNISGLQETGSLFGIHIKEK